MIIRTLSLILLLAFPFSLANAQTANSTADNATDVEQLIIKPDFKIPDLSREWQEYIIHLTTLNKEIERLKAELEAKEGGLEGALETDSAAIKTRIKRTRTDVNFYNKYKADISVWRQQLSNRPPMISEAALAWGMQQQSFLYAKTLGIRFMADAYYRAGNLSNAINLGHIALTNKLSGYDRRLLLKDYSLWLDNASLRAGDPQYDLTAMPVSACIAFAHRLAEKQPLPLGDYIRTDGNKKLATSIKGRNLCVSGLTFGEEFTLTIRRGLVATNGAVLAGDAHRQIRVRDRSPSLRFSSNKWLAPITGNEMIAAHSVNMESAELSLYRVGERAIHQAMREGLFAASLQRYRVNTINNQLGETVWRGKVELATETNKEVTTLIPVREMLKVIKPGLYIIKADWKTGNAREDQNNWSPRPLQWLLFSDTGLTAVRGNDGLTVISRKLSSAEPQASVKLSLVAVNNEILASTTSDKKGIAHFPAGLLRGKDGNRPSHLTGEAGGGDFTMLRLNVDALDLSDFDISGRTAQPEGDMYLFSERPVYRPGEEVFLNGYLRDKDARAISGQQLELKLIRPDGTQDRKLVLEGDSLGAYAYDFDLSATARTGRWRVSLSYPGQERTLTSASFEVQDFVPLRLKAELSSASDIAKGSDPLELSLAADFLYGAPASGLGSYMRASLRRASRPFEGYESYNFGLLDDTFSQLSILDEKGKLSQEGKQSLSLVVEQNITTSRPLEIAAGATVFDIGGRPASAYKIIPYRHEAVSVGARMGEIITSGETEGRAEGQLVALSSEGEPVANRNLMLRWIKEDYDYQWYQRGGYWRSKTVIYDTLIAEDQHVTDTDGLLAAQRTLSNGAYRLEVSDLDGTSKASVRFHVGWWSWNRQANEPDQLDLKLSGHSLASGETLSGKITAPFNGKVTLMVVTDRVHHLRAFDLNNGTADFSLKVDKDWGPGAYIMATAFRPTGENKAEEAHLPVRATTFVWFDIDHTRRKLSVDIKAPESVLPRKSVTIPLEIKGLDKGEKARVTMLAVDEGVLRLMAFRSPSLSGHFMGKRALGVAVHDLYGRLLMGEKGMRGTLSTGGDAAFEAMRRVSLKAPEPGNNRAVLTTRSRRAVALITRDVEVSADGTAAITMDMPDFVGQLRLMAVAYSAERMGESQAPLIVRDPIAADLILPRFMAPGDTASPMITVQNLSGKPQKLKLKLDVVGPIEAIIKGTTEFELADGKRLDLPVELTGTGVGTATFKLSVTGTKEPIERSWNMAVRSPYGYESRATGRMVDAGEEVLLKPGGVGEGENPFINGTTYTNVMISNAPDLKVDKMIADLRVYRYMCTEQTVSRAMPMLYADNLVAAGLSDKDKHHYAAELDQAIERLLMRQNRKGDFGLWRAYDKGNDWASLYAIDFLMRAAEAGYHVPEGSLQRSLEWMRSFRAGRTHHKLMSYAFYLRARAGEVERGDVRHYAVTTQKLPNSPLTEAYLAAALAIVGEKDLARIGFKHALETEWRYKYFNHFYDYGSILRDRAATITLLAESGVDDSLLFKAGSELERLTASQRWFNTQQQAWLVRAASQLSSGQQLSLSQDGENLLSLKGVWQQAIVDATTVTNTGDQPVRFIETVRGIPAKAPATVSNGTTIQRHYFDLEGNIVDTDNIRQNDRFIVLITGNVLRKGTEASLVLDLLPAGLEIENASVGGDSQLNQYEFLPKLTQARYSSELDDRYFAVLDNRTMGEFNFAYMVRAITPGKYAQPPVMIEDMYAPQIRAVGYSGSLTIYGSDE